MSSIKAVIASHRPWNRDLATRLEQRCPGAAFQPIARPEDLTSPALAAIDPDMVFFPHWSHRIPADIFKAFPCILFHMTDLPYGRGGSPLQNLIVRGHSETMISALRCVGALDAGPIYLKRPLSLLGTAEEIFLRANRVIEDMIVEIVETRPVPVEQAGEPVVFHRRKPEDGDLRDVENLDRLFDCIRMLDADGYPPAFLEVGPFRLSFTRASRRADAVIADVRISRIDEAADD